MTKKKKQGQLGWQEIHEQLATYVTDFIMRYEDRLDSDVRITGMDLLNSIMNALAGPVPDETIKASTNPITYDKSVADKGGFTFEQRFLALRLAFAAVEHHPAQLQCIADGLQVRVSARRQQPEGMA